MENNQHPKTQEPFACSYSPQFAEILYNLKISLAISTYQAGKLILLCPKNEDQITQLPRNFQRPMGIALEGDRMAIATSDEVIYFKNSEQLAWHYPKNPGVYDALFVPRATYFTSRLDIHDLEFGHDGLYAVNTSFSCIIKIDEQYSFTPVWKPSFITEIAHEDRCHLNGMAMVEGKPRYATAFNEGNTPKSWSSTLGEQGILIDMQSNEILTRGLEMPHSPRYFDNKLYVLQSRNGAIATIDTNTGAVEEIRRLNCFVRGFEKIGDYLFVAYSRIRKHSSIFGKLDVSDKSNHAGIAVIHATTGALMAEFKYLNSVEEIYDIKIIKGYTKPNIMNTIRPEFKLSVVLPDSTFWAPLEVFEQQEKFK
jgi:uncharacterized protein (TIGR03032 family)